MKKTPPNLDIYRPVDYISNEPITPTIRRPKPPQWITAIAQENSNYFKISRFLQKKVGSIKPGDISRFGKNSVLVHAKSKTQSLMLCNLKTENSEIVLKVRPHMNFSYGRGVIFNRDLYEFPEQEILDMCPNDVWKIQKVPRTSMIILTFNPFNPAERHLMRNIDIAKFLEPREQTMSDKRKC